MEERQINSMAIDHWRMANMFACIMLKSIPKGIRNVIRAGGRTIIFFLQNIHLPKSGVMKV